MRTMANKSATGKNRLHPSGAVGVFGLLAVIVITLLWAACARPGAGTLVAPGGVVPTAQQDVRGVRAAQLKQLMAQRRGRVLLVNLWATWCDACVAELPDLVALYRRWQSQGMELLLVSVDDIGQLSETANILRTQGIDFTTYIRDPQEADFITAFGEGWSGTLPANLLYDRSGRLVKMWQGEVAPEVIGGAVEKWVQRKDQHGFKDQ